ncbi:MAG: nucleotidyltransferase family protein [Candidatus Omnitrophica bacterium]|nr:nucleotidyltransferase family protein [Candidatus Omnitrophota bacterium]
MKALILAAGYGTRLYPLTLNKPKALLKIGDKTILGRILDSVFTIEECDITYIVSNKKFYDNFYNWADNQNYKKKIEVLNDGTTSNEDRLGAIGDIDFALEATGLFDDLLVLGSDNLFEFKLKDFTDFALSKRPNASLALYDIKNIKKAPLYGIAVLKQKNSEIIDFQEKPERPKSTLAATAVYFYPKEKLNLIKEYMKEDLTKDAPGNFVKWLKGREPVYGYVFEENWYDIGDKASLKKADEEYRKKEGRKKNEKT